MSFPTHPLTSMEQIGTNLLQQQQDPSTLLNQLLSHLRPILRDLVGNFLNSEDGKEFQRIPASRSFHHCEAAGLLAHSIECAFIAGQTAFSLLSRAEAELTLVAALFHDIGKCRTHQSSGFTSTLGQYISHEALTLELLAPSLSQLEVKWPQGANILRCLLAQDNPRYQFPSFPGKLLVTSADHVSTALDRRKRLFSDHPEYHYYAYDPVNRQQYLRLS